MVSQTWTLETLPHYTYEDFEQWEGQWEIIKGIPFAMTPAPTMKHQRLSFKIAAQLDRLLRHCNKNCKMYQAIDWQLTNDTIIQPDVLVVCGDFIEKKRLEIPPVLVFEILSPSTSQKDKVLKYGLYQDAGVQYYCIVTPEPVSIDVFHLNGDEYKKDDEPGDGKFFFKTGECSLEFDVFEIFSE